MKWGKYAQAGRHLRLDLGIDGQGDVLKFHGLYCDTGSSHRDPYRLTNRNYSEV